MAFSFQRPPHVSASAGPRLGERCLATKSFGEGGQLSRGEVLPEVQVCKGSKHLAPKRGTPVFTEQHLHFQHCKRDYAWRTLSSRSHENWMKLDERAGEGHLKAFNMRTDIYIYIYIKMFWCFWVKLYENKMLISWNLGRIFNTFFYL